MNNNFILSA